MTFNKETILPIALATVGVVFTTYSYELSSAFFDPFLLRYVFSYPMQEAVYSVERFLGYFNIMNTIVTAVGVLFLAAAIYLGARFIAKTTTPWKRMAGVVFVTFVAFDALMTLASFWR